MVTIYILEAYGFRLGWGLSIFKFNKKEVIFFVLFCLIFKRLLFLGPQRGEAVLHRVEHLVRRPLATPPLFARVKVAARVRRHLLLRLGIDILIRPARRLDLARHRRAQLPLAVLAPQRLRRALVAVEPLAGALDLAARLVLLDADARLDSHQFCVALHFVGNDRQVLERLFCSCLIEAAQLLVERLCLQEFLLFLVDLICPRNEAWLDDQPFAASRADPRVVLNRAGCRATLAGEDIVVERPERFVLVADGHFGCLEFIPSVTP